MEGGHKRERSLPEAPVALEEILTTTKKPRVSFSMVKADDLTQAGVAEDWLRFKEGSIAQAMKQFAPRADPIIEGLHRHLKKIHAHVNTNSQAISRMTMDWILITVAEIASVDKRNVVIIPGLRFPATEEVQLANLDSGFELWLSGNVDYAVIEYDDAFDDTIERVLARGGSRVALEHSKRRLFLVRAKRQAHLLDLRHHIPEAVSQAIALLKSYTDPEVRFCLSNGEFWIFFILKLEDGKLTYYESAQRRLSKESLENSDEQLREILMLVCEWLHPTVPDLFILGDNIQSTGQ